MKITSRYAATLTARLMFLGLYLFCPFLTADEIRPAYLELKAKNPTGYEVLWKQPVVEDRRLPIDPVFPTHCVLRETSAPEFTGSALIRRWSTTCDLTKARVEVSGLRTSITDVMVRVIDRDGSFTNYIVQPSQPTLNLANDDISAVSYLTIGITHLLGGIDHVLFVIGLVLFIHSPWVLLKTITAFTVAHSITLALSILGWVTLPQGPVEAVIALSIVFLARELAQPEEQRSALTLSSPWLMAFLFGLLHGLGFAGVLREIGLPQETLFTSVLLFNVGIEIGQIIVVSAFAALLWLWRKLSESLSLQTQLLYTSSAYAMGSVAMYWTIDRTLVLF